MDLGFETIGNATLICHDHGPVLATDPWIIGSAYFGSWTLSHTVPDEQMEAIKRCKYIWISHGHPDHLSLESLALLKGKTILLPNHVGGRIAKDLNRLGYNVMILKDGRWTNLSPRLHVLCIANYNQDGILLVDIGGTLIVNLNDGTPLGWASFVKGIIRKYKQTFLLRLFGYGDADMINFIDEDGRHIEPQAAKRFPIGRYIQLYAEGCGIRNIIPFSSMHKYQRSDSAWANQYTTPLPEYRIGFDSARCMLLPAFISYDCIKELPCEIRPDETPSAPVDPKIFGDDWDEPLDSTDVQKLARYFRSIEHLHRGVDFINFRVSGGDHIIELSARRFKTGVRFEVPRHSLMQTIEHECFDDLLIGNFMRTCLIGKWPKYGLYPDFTPYVAKYADNGRARTAEELRLYFREYRKRAPAEYLGHRLEEWAYDHVRRHVSPDSQLLNSARGTLK
jgi:L-ascorbate metabolism protein UlaG (beta-lactamase superfamily)